MVSDYVIELNLDFDVDFWVIDEKIEKELVKEIVVVKKKDKEKGLIKECFIKGEELI